VPWLPRHQCTLHNLASLDTHVGIFARFAKSEIFCFPEIACWMYSGERQVIALRKAYLDAVLRQDVGFFDTDARTGDIVFGVSTDTLLVQDAIGEKVGNFIHYLATFLAGLVVGFVSAWRLALLSVAVIPAIAFAGGLYAYTLTGLTSRSRESYANAGVVAEQVIPTLWCVLRDREELLPGASWSVFSSLVASDIFLLD
jgi:ABC-type multidrug transport system fused ATPase/permease subunit